MTREIQHLDRVRVSDALDFFEPKTLATLASESGVDIKIVRKIVNAKVESGSVERRGNLYRIQHAAPWGTKNPGIKTEPAPAENEPETCAKHRCKRPPLAGDIYCAEHGPHDFPDLPPSSRKRAPMEDT